MSVTVGDSFQGRGVGTLLVRVLAEAARAAGIRRLTALVLADNEPMLSVFRRFGAHMALEPAAGAIRVSLDLEKVPPPG
jgi:L-amino acid N-acyltransferase YncA